MNEFDEWLDYAVSVNDNIQLKYYEVKFVVLDTTPNRVRKVLIYTQEPKVKMPVAKEKQ